MRMIDYVVMYVCDHSSWYVFRNVYTPWRDRVSEHGGENIDT